MKIAVLVRTRNEEKNIAKFCEGYSFADHILVADAESEDKTVQIAKTYKNVLVRPFTEKVYYGDSWRSNEPKHINYLINWALDLNPDWIIYDDADCYPNYLLKENARRIFKEAKTIVKAYRLYLYKDHSYFPDMNNAGKSLWAWKPSIVDVHCDESGDPREQNLVVGYPDDHTYFIDHPYVLLHNFAQSDEDIERKMEFYKNEGKPQRHPLEGCGRLERLPDYAYPYSR